MITQSAWQVIIVVLCSNGYDFSLTTDCDCPREGSGFDPQQDYLFAQISISILFGLESPGVL